MKYSLVKESEKHYEVSHPEHGTFKVAKAGLDKATHKKIKSLPKGYADGGEVEDEGAAPPAAAGELAAAANRGEGQGELSDAPLAKLFRGQIDLFGNENPDYTPPAGTKAAAKPAQAEAPDQTAQVSSNPNTSFGVMQSDQNQGGMQKVSDTSGQIAPALTLDGKNDIYGIGDSIKAVQDSVRQQNEAAAQVQTAAKDYNTKMGNLQNDYNHKLAAIDKENADLTDAVTNQKIDPNRIWSNVSTGGKVGAAIGILLSGIGSGLTGQKNMAMEVINDAINRDIDAQKTELGKKHTLLSINMQKYGRLDQATMATSAQLNSMLQGQIAAAAAKSQNAQTKQNAALAISQLKQQQMSMNMQLAQWQMGQRLAGGTPGAVNLEALPKDMRERVVTLPDGSMHLAKTSKGAEETQESIKAIANLKGLVQQAKDFQKNVGRTMWNSDNDKIAEDIQSGIVLNLNKLHGLNRLTDREFVENNRMAPNPGAWRQDRAAKGIGFIEKMIKDVEDAEYLKLENFNPGAAGKRDERF